MTKLIEKRKEFEAKQKKLKGLWDEAGPERDLTKIKDLTGDTSARLASLRAMNDELDAIHKDIEEMVAVEDLVKTNDARAQHILKAMPGDGVHRPESQPVLEPVNLGKAFMNLPNVKEMFKQGGYKAGIVGGELAGVGLKTVMTTTAGWVPETIRMPGVVIPYATRPIQIIDIVPPGRTGQNAVVWMEETTFTNAAAETTESSGAAAEAALALTERSANIRDITVYIPVTRQQLQDVDEVESYINQRLTFMIRQRLDSQLLVGNGSAPNLIGLIGAGNTTLQTYVRAGDKFDAAYIGQKNVRVTGRAQPNVYVFHPNDWQDLRLQRSNDGLYILGNPNENGPDRLWGLPVVQSDAITENTVLVGDFASMCQLFERDSVTVEITDSHSDWFVYSKYAIRAIVRCALAIYRGSAFCAITQM